MKKLSKSVKAIIISLVSVVCVAAIVLGCVFGLSGNNPSPDDPEQSVDPSNPTETTVDPVGFTTAQSLLATEINSNASSSVTYEVLSSVPYSSFCADNKVLEYSSDYFIYLNDSKSYEFVVYYNEGGETKTLSLTSGYSGSFYSMANNTGYALIAYNGGSGSYYSLTLKYYGDYGSTVDIFSFTASSSEYLDVSCICLTDNYLAFSTYIDSTSTYNLYSYALKTTAYTSDEIDDCDYVAGLSSVSDFILYNDNYIAVIEGGAYIDVFLLANDKMNLIPFEQKNNFYYAFEIGENNVLIEYRETIAAANKTSTSVYDSLSDSYYKYSYELVHFNEDGSYEISDYSLSSGYAYVWALSSEETYLTESYVIFEQKVDSSNEPIDEYLVRYFDASGELIIEYEADSLEMILYAGEKHFVTSGKIIYTNKDMNVYTKLEFDDGMSGGYELYSTEITSNIFAIRMYAGLYGLMDADGNLLTNPEDYSFEPYVITDDYVLGYYSLEVVVDDGDNVITTGYCKYDIATGELSSLGLYEDDETMLSLLKAGFDGYFVQSGETLKLVSGSGETIAENISTSDVSYYGTNAGVIASFGSSLKVLIDNISVSGISVNGSVSVYLDGSTYSSDDSIDSYISCSTGSYSSSNDAYWFTVTGGQQGKYIESMQVYYKYTSKYYVTCTGTVSGIQLDVSSFMYNFSTSVSGIYWHTAWSSGSTMTYGWSSGYCTWRYMADDSDRTCTLVSESYNYRAYTITLNNQDADYSGTSTIYLFYYTGFSSSSSSYSSISSITIPVRVGYSFNGYYTSTGGGGTKIIDSSGSIVGSSSYTSSKDTLYAYWTENTYYISYDYDGGSAGTYAPSSASYTSTVTVSAPTKTGYTFSGWTITLLGSYYIYARGYSYPYQIATHGTSSSSLSAFSNSSYDSRTSYGYVYYYYSNSSVYVYTRYVYTYTYTFSETGTTYYQYLNPGNVTTSYGSSTTYNTVTFTANWTANTYTLRLYSYSGSSTYTDYSCTYDTTSSISYTTRTGYTYTGIYFGSNSSYLMDTNTHYFGTSSSLGTSSSATSYTYSCGYQATVYFKNLTAKDLTVDGQTKATVYAYRTWTANRYYVSFTLNGGSMSTPSSLTTYDSTNNIYYTTYTTTFKVYDPTLTGYTFSGWTISGMSTGLTKCYGYTTSVGSSLAASSTTSTTLNDDTSYDYTYFKYLNTGTDNSTTKSTSNTVTFSANWTANTYYIRLYYYNGSSTYNTITCKYDTTGSISSTTRTGYTYAGIYFGSNSSYLMDSNTHNFGTSSSLGTSSSATSYSYSTSSSATIYFKNLTVTSGKTIYAYRLWTANTYNLRLYESSSSSTYTDYSCTYDTVSSISYSTQTGYTYSGIYFGSSSSYLMDSNTHYFGTSSSLGTSSSATSYTYSCGYQATVYFKNLTATKGGTVYAYRTWTANTYYIEFSLGGGSVGTLSGLTYSSSNVYYTTYDTTISSTIPTRTGYTFTSWTITGMTSSIVNYYGTSSASSTLAASGTTTATLSSGTYYFKNLNTGVAGDTTKVTSNTVTFTASWNPNTYSISYTLNSGTAGTSAPTTATYDTSFTVSNPTRTGYTFSGWSLSNMTTDCTHYVGSTSTTTTSSTYSGATGTYFMNLRSTSGTVTLSATWKANTYYITYNYNDNGDGGAGTYAPTSATYDTEFQVSNAERPGYTFVSWSISGMSSGITKYYGTSTSPSNAITTSTTSITITKAYTYFLNLNTGISGDTEKDTSNTVTFTANWSVNTYYITYDFNGGTAGSGTYPSTATFDTSFAVSEPATAPTGYHFYAWSISGMSSGITKYYGTSSSTTSSISSSTTSTSVYGTYFKNLNVGSTSGSSKTSSNTVTFTAVWEANVYNIEYVLSDSRGSGSISTSSPTTASYDSWVTILEPTRTGYTFTGWSLSSLSDDVTHYYNSQASGTGTSFTSSSGNLNDTDDPSLLMVLDTSYCCFKNLHYQAGATVTLTANWSSDTYSITYYFLPSTFSVSNSGEAAMGVVSNFTQSKTVTVTYDGLITLLKAGTDITTTTISIPSDVVLGGWAIYNSVQTGTFCTYSNNAPTTTSSKNYAPGVEMTYNDTYFYASNVYAYAYYQLAEITIEYYAVTSANKSYINLPYYYTSSGTTTVKTYGTVALPSTLNSVSVVGYMVSSNRLDGGILNTGSITVMTYSGTDYTLTSGSTVYWTYSTDLAYDLSNPTFYVYAVYEPEYYTITYDGTAPSTASYITEGYIESVTVDAGSSITLPTATGGFTLIGYTLTGWTFTDSNNTSYTLSVGATFKPSSYSGLSSTYVTLYAVWTANTYTISYELNSGSESSSGSYPTSATFDTWFKVSVPTRTGYVLTEYYVTGLTTGQIRYYGSSTSSYSTLTSNANEISRTSSSSTSSITSDYYYKNLRSESGTITFVAVWTPVVYTISYDFGDGTTNTQSVNYGDIITLIAPNEKIGYTLSNCALSGLTKNYAQYSASSSFSSYLTATATSVIFSDSSYVYYYFRNLSTTSGGTVTVTYSWTANRYEVQFTYYSGTTDTITCTYDTWTTLATITRSGYTYAGFTVTGMDNYAHYFGSSTSSYVTVYSSAYSNSTYTYYKNLRADGNDVYITYEWTNNSYSATYASTASETIVLYANKNDEYYLDLNETEQNKID